MLQACTFLPININQFVYGSEKYSGKLNIGRQTCERRLLGEPATRRKDGCIVPRIIVVITTRHNGHSTLTAGILVWMSFSITVSQDHSMYPAYPLHRCVTLADALPFCGRLLALIGCSPGTSQLLSHPALPHPTCKQCHVTCGNCHLVASSSGCMYIVNRVSEILIMHTILLIHLICWCRQIMREKYE